MLFMHSRAEEGMLTPRFEAEEMSEQGANVLRHNSIGMRHRLENSQQRE